MRLRKDDNFSSIRNKIHSSNEQIEIEKPSNYLKMQKGAFKCALCTATFDKQQGLNGHVKIHRNEGVVKLVE